MGISTVFKYGTYNILHPELRSKDQKWIESRGGWYNFFYPDGEQINWYGDMIRNDSDGGAGMYATRDQHQRWPHKYVGPSVVGPTK